MSNWLNPMSVTKTLSWCYTNFRLGCFCCYCIWVGIVVTNAVDRFTVTVMDHLLKQFKVLSQPDQAFGGGGQIFVVSSVVGAYHLHKSVKWFGAMGRALGIGFNRISFNILLDYKHLNREVTEVLYLIFFFLLLHLIAHTFYVFTSVLRRFIILSTWKSI